MSIVSRTIAEVGNALKDAYGHVFHGDDAGTYETKALILYPQKVKIHGQTTHKFDLGMSFLNVNGRAFVKTVQPGSEAALKGIRSQDCLQLAMVLGRSGKFERMQNDERKAISYGMQCEKQGRRTSFKELKDMFENCSLRSNIADVEIFDSSDDGVSDIRNIPLSRRIRNTTQEMVGRCSGITVNDLATDLPSDRLGVAQYPVVLIFRHTHKRYAGSNPHVAMPYFRLDDECERAALIVRRLAPTVDSKVDPDAWDEIMENAQKFLSPNKMSHASPTPASTEKDGNNVEAETIRGLIQGALGLAFIRTSKVVLGLSFHFGSGIVISRLEDGTWSAPSAIGMYGAGLGVQFGLEVADYIFILQTEDALNHFRQGTNYTIGGNMGAAVGGIGREAYGAASVGTKDGQVTHTQVSPIVAYAKSQGLYFGVSLEGSKIFARDEINRRAYKFKTGRDFSTDDILSGRVPPPREAEDLYATLHSVEFAHEMINLPKPPHRLLEDLFHDWVYNSSTLTPKNGNHLDWLSALSSNESKEMSLFETKFKSFLYGGVSVQRILPQEKDGGGLESLERRTLWLMLPDVGSLRLGFISKRSGEYLDDRSEVSGGLSQTSRDHTVEESVTDDFTADSRSTSFSGRRRTGKVILSKKHCISLTDVLSVKRYSTNAGNPNDDKRELRVIEIVDKYGRNLKFIANTLREAELLFCGLKVVLERETIRMGRRGGVSLDKLIAVITLEGPNDKEPGEETFGELDLDTSSVSDCSSSENGEKDEQTHDVNVPECRGSWSQVPSREHLRMKASSQQATNILPLSKDNPSIIPKKIASPVYSLGDQLTTDIATSVSIPLPLPLCRALFLDSTSPLIRRWEVERGDMNYSRTPWNFPPSSPRHPENGLPENTMLASGSMQGGHRTVLFDRVRNGESVRLSETIVVLLDNDETLALAISERMPRRGFSSKVRVYLTKDSKHKCSVSIFADIVPIGKDLSNQAAVHRAFLLLVEELKDRYGADNTGLLAILLTVVKSLPSPDNFAPTHPSERKIDDHHSSTSKTLKSSGSDVTFPSSFSPGDDVASQPVTAVVSTVNQQDSVVTPRRREMKPKNDKNDRPSTPSFTKHNGNQIDNFLGRPSHQWATSEFFEWDEAFADMPTDDVHSNVNVTIDVKPLPKLRLDLMPAPREEDEDNISSL